MKELVDLKTTCPESDSNNLRRQFFFKLGFIKISNHLYCRTKLANVSSENMFKDLIAGHARELVNSQVRVNSNLGHQTIIIMNISIFRLLGNNEFELDDASDLFNGEWRRHYARPALVLSWTGVHHKLSS